MRLVTHQWLGFLLTGSEGEGTGVAICSTLRILRTFCRMRGAIGEQRRKDLHQLLVLLRIVVSIVVRIVAFL